MIDVIIPAYNCSKTIERTLSSLVAQTDKDFNVIVVDDCSTEDFRHIIDKFTNTLNITYIRKEENTGPGMARQTGIENAKSKFITFLDSDDMFMPYTVETFNTVIKFNPDTEYLHTHIYAQIYQDDVPVLILMSDNYTACHGKLYNIELINKFGIKNSPEVKWSDDSFFNSMCSELLTLSILKIPTVLWTYNKESVLRRTDPVRDKNKIKDFINAMKLSADFVRKFKPNVDHLESTIKRVLDADELNDDEKKEINKLLERSYE